MTELPLTPERVWRRIRELKHSADREVLSDERSSSAAAVIGTGTMGPGHGRGARPGRHQVALYDVSPEALERAKAGYRAGRGRPRPPRGAGRRRAARCASRPTSAGALAGADVVLEAIPERLELKHAGLRASSRQHIGPETRSSPPTPRASRSPRSRTVCEHPERVIGMHWSNPPHLIPMIEVIPGEQTTRRASTRRCALIRSIGYHPAGQEGGPRLRREPHPLRDHARVPGTS